MKYIFVDGSCSRNPGHIISYGVIVNNEDGTRFGELCGIVENESTKVSSRLTSIIAEATAILKAVEFIGFNIENEDVTLFTDSLTLSNVLNGLTRPRQGKHYTTIIDEVKRLVELLKEFDQRVLFVHIKRRQNKEADALCKEAYHNFLMSEDNVLTYDNNIR